MTANENRPRMGTGAASESVVATPSQDTEAPAIPHLSASDIAASMPGYVLIVKTPTDRLTRRCYLSLHAAEMACRRAQQRGHAATLELHRLVPYRVGSELWGGETR